MGDAQDVSVEGCEVGVSGHRGFSCGQAEWQLLEALAGEALDAQEAPSYGAISVSNVIRCGAPAEVIRVAAAGHVARMETQQLVRKRWLKEGEGDAVGPVLLTSPPEPRPSEPSAPLPVRGPSPRPAARWVATLDVAPEASCEVRVRRQVHAARSRSSRWLNRLMSART